MKPIKLIALDLDGTLFDSHGQISSENIKAIKAAASKGIYVVISTGRPLIGVPFDKIKDTGIDYAITANGAAVYRLSTRECIYENPMPREDVLKAVDFILSHQIHMDAFINGLAYSPLQCLPVGQNIAVPDQLKKYILGDSRQRVEDIRDFIKTNPHQVQKITTNYTKDAAGNLVNRQEMIDYLLSTGSFTVVTGGYNNIEFTKKGADKGLGLTELARYLKINPDETMAVGDTGNDLAIIKACGFGVAMGNATDDIKNAADYITLSNDQSGVAAAIEKILALHLG